MAFPAKRMPGLKVKRMPGLKVKRMPGLSGRTARSR